MRLDTTDSLPVLLTRMTTGFGVSSSDSNSQDFLDTNSTESTNSRCRIALIEMYNALTMVVLPQLEDFPFHLGDPCVVRNTQAEEPQPKLIANPLNIQQPLNAMPRPESLAIHRPMSIPLAPSTPRQAIHKAMPLLPTVVTQHLSLVLP